MFRSSIYYNTLKFNLNFVWWHLSRPFMNDTKKITPTIINFYRDSHNKLQSLPSQKMLQSQALGMLDLAKIANKKFHRRFWCSKIVRENFLKLKLIF